MPADIPAFLSSLADRFFRDGLLFEVDAVAVVPE